VKGKLLCYFEVTSKCISELRFTILRCSLFCIVFCGLSSFFFEKIDRVFSVPEWSKCDLLLIFSSFAGHFVVHNCENSKQASSCVSL